MDAIGNNLQAVKRRIAEAAAASARDAADVTLVAVSKGMDAQRVAAACAHGQRVFGESYVQEALAKMKELAPLVQHSVDWHFVGPIQSNKTRAIAENFAWVHGIDRVKIAERLAAARPAGLLPLQACLQINIGGEATKSGVAPEAALPLAQAVAQLPGLKLRGLMAIPPESDDYAEQRRHCAALRAVKERLSAAGIALDTLSMGMSADLEAAIAEGATLVRVGTAIFGLR
jgi:pyridoxal phosphate enzyme (YggS family)